jgi:hypothetical protein
MQMRNCWSMRTILSATVAAGLLTAGCGSDSAEDEGNGTADMGAGGEGGTPTGGSTGGSTGGDEPPVGGDEPPVGGEGGAGGGGGGGGGEEPPPVGECGPTLPVVDLNAAAEASGTTFTYEGTTGESDESFASCSPAEAPGSETVHKFTAPEAGYWRFSTEGTVWDSVLYALEDCQDGFTEVACNDDVGGGAVSSAIMLEMEAGQTTYVFVDQIDQLRASAYTLTAEKIDAAKPEISDFRAYYSDVTGVAGIRVTGTDADMDVTQFRWGVYGADGQPVQLDQAQNELQLPFEEFPPFVLTQNPDGSYAVEGVAAPQGGFPLLTKMTFQFGDANGLWSDVAEADVMPTDVIRQHDEACDGGRALDTCVDTDACADEDGDGAFVCVTATAPTVTASGGFYNTDANSMAVHLVGNDVENNLGFVRVTAFNAAGEELPFGQAPGATAIGLYRAQQADGAFDALAVFNVGFEGLCFPAAQADFDECMAAGGDQETCANEANAIYDVCNRETAATVTRLSVVAVDDTLKASEAFDVAIAPTPVQEAGGTCDVVYASGICPEGQACANLPGGDAYDTCADPADAACPESYGAIDLTAEGGEGPWSAEGDNAMAQPAGGFGSCGGGGPTVVYSFTAPADGNYNARTGGLGENVDSLLYVRSACAFYGEDFELGCNDDIDTQGGNYASAVDFMATAGQTVYIFVDSYAGQFPGAFTVTVSGP